MWPRTEDKDLHPSTPELLGVLLHWILWFTICDDHQHAGKIFPGTGLFGERILQEKVKGLSWEKEMDEWFNQISILTAKFSISLQLHWISHIEMTDFQSRSRVKCCGSDAGYLSWCLHPCTAESQWRGAALGGSGGCSGWTPRERRCRTGPRPLGFCPAQSEKRLLLPRWNRGCVWSWLCPRSTNRPPRTAHRPRFQQSILGEIRRQAWKRRK